MIRAPDERTAIALAGLFQATALVDQIARTGIADSETMSTCLESIFRIDADSTAAVYGGLEHLQPGLRLLVQQLEGGQGRNLQVTQYVIVLLQLERRLSANAAMLAQLRDGIERIDKLRQRLGALHDDVIAPLSELYVQTVSTLRPRVIVRGQAGHLNRPLVATRVRALLLAGVRAAVLWSQVGGGRLQLMWHRRRIVRLARALLQRAESQPTHTT
ncbi:MAG: high frequency lysogenization protein HflD [Chromatiales bacterium]|nr:high frequency lysogenization protein HflD [Chromatiales bacterium]